MLVTPPMRGGKLLDLVEQAWGAARSGKSVAIIVPKLPAPCLQRLLRDFAQTDRKVVSVRRISGACYRFPGGGKLELVEATQIVHVESDDA